MQETWGTRKTEWGDAFLVRDDVIVSVSMISHEILEPPFEFGVRVFGGKFRTSKAAAKRGSCDKIVCFRSRNRVDTICAQGDESLSRNAALWVVIQNDDTS